MREPIIFTREDWFAQADFLFPGVRDAELQARLDEMWANVERLDAEHWEKVEAT